MIKIKVYHSSGGHVKYDNSYIWEGTFVYNVYFLGFIIHSVRISGLTGKAAELMFGKDRIIWADDEG